jgi:glycosyltransferase involved in cell wall biosynthesis
VLQALAKCREPVRVVFSGTVENAADVEALRRDAQRLGVDGRVIWKGRVDEEEKFSLYAGCRAVVFTPWDEDYGYVPLEGMLAAKAVVTCTDSGGAREFVVDGGTGRIVDPSAEAVAEALDLLWRDKALAARMGAAGRDHLSAAGLDWSHVVSRLLA